MRSAAGVLCAMAGRASAGMRKGRAAMERGFGCLLPAGLFLGLGLGALWSEPSLGMVIGFAAGGLLALGLALREGRRR
jgi:hypothetical protein